jgi:hypothetical protein
MLDFDTNYQKREPMTEINTPDKQFAAICGLFCPACTVFIGTKEEPDRLKYLAQRMGHSVEEIECSGCRSEKRCFSCESCKITTCAAEKELDFCGECSDYPCEQLKIFQAQMPHRIELWEDQTRIKEVGYEQWYREKIEHYSCPECHTINSAYDISCRKCGATPGSAFVSLHKDEIVQHLSKLK